MIFRQILPSNLNPTNKMSFLDLYKDGKVDLLTHEIKTTILSPTVNISQQVITTYFNNQHFDAFFMKITVLHGDSSIVDQNINVIGANVDLYITQLGGNYAPKIGNQLSQTGRTLQLPYIFFGLGRTNNYVEDLTITIPISVIFNLI
jgi:integrin alpha FG-GAP repeat containing protein 1